MDSFGSFPTEVLFVQRGRVQERGKRTGMLSRKLGASIWVVFEGAQCGGRFL